MSDTNLVAYLLIDGAHSASAENVWERDRDWCAPPLWRSEFLNVLATSIRAGILAEEQAFDVWRTASEFLQIHEIEPRAETVLAASIRDGISAYDAQFVVTAEELGVPLISRDARLAAARPDLVKTPEEFCRP